jgi:hypothetical protein
MINLRGLLSKRAEELEGLVKALLDDLEINVRLVDTMRSPLPENVSEIRNRMLIVMDELQYIIDKASDETTDLREMNEKYERAAKILSKNVDDFPEQLNIAVDDHLLKIRYEVLESVNLMKELGFHIELPNIPENQHAPLEAKIMSVKNFYRAGRTVTNELIKEVEEIYIIISSLYDRSLPRVSPTIQISKQKVEEDDPWIVVEALVQAVRNWERQYSKQIDTSVQQLSRSFINIQNLGEKEDQLKPLFGHEYQKIRNLSKGVQFKQHDYQREEYQVLRVVEVRDAIYSFTEVLGGILQILYQKLKNLGESIVELMPLPNYQWGSNTTLLQRIEGLLETVANYRSRRLDEALDNLYRGNAYIEEALETLEYYYERREMLLNYPVLEKRIEEVYKANELVNLKDLPVTDKYAEEYLKIYYNKHFPQLAFIESDKTLRKRM